VRAEVDQWSGSVRLRFPYDPATIEVIKTYPGSRWDKAGRFWTVPIDAWDVFKGLFKYEETISVRTGPLPLFQTPKPLRPYQVEAANFLTSRSGAMLTMDMRTGKTPTAIAALASMFLAEATQLSAPAALICYPASIREVWADQLMDWAQLHMIALEGYSPLDPAELIKLHQTPYLVLGCHYEILQQREEEIHAILAGRKFIVIADELHQCKNRKARRTQALLRLSKADGWTVIGADEDSSKKIPTGICRARWGLTGTPMRNRNRDLYCLFDFVRPGSMGSYWKGFATRYADAHIDDHGHWTDLGESNSAELERRLATVSYRVTRAQVAAYLPKSDRSVIACAMPEALMKKYRALEKAYATQVIKALDETGSRASEDSLKHLAQATVEAKIPTAVDRAYEHAARGVKVLVFATYHETLKNLEERFDTYAAAEKDATDTILPPHFCAGGWKTPIKRGEIIETWRACPGPSILLANTLSSGVGIDLADAEVAIFVELAWVPADFRQAEDRIQDVHKGKRITPPIYEYLITKGTIDEAMAAKLLEKIRNIESVVGSDAETGGVAQALRGAGVVGSARLGLANNSDETVLAALAAIRNRWLDEGDAPSSASLTPQERLAGLAAGLDDDPDDEMLDEDQPPEALG